MGVTIKDIARLANVSHTTVSRALNDSPLINPETKERIKAIAKSLNYTPNVSAKSLVLDRSYNIGLFFSTLRTGTSAGFLYDAVRGVNSLIHGQYNLVVKGIDDYRSEYALSRKQFDGILVMSQSTDDNEFIRTVCDKRIPLVVLNRRVEDECAPCILSDDRTGAYRLTEYLIAQGHRRIAAIEGKAGFKSAQERRKGYLDALKRHGIEIPAEYWVQGNYDVESGYVAMRKLLKQEPLATAIFCFNDDMAVGAMKAIQDAGLKVPDDISVAGFDDSMFAAYLTPALTTVRRPIERISREGATLLLQLIDKRPAERKVVAVDTELVIRDSVKSPR